MKNVITLFCIAVFTLCSCNRMMKADYDLGDKEVSDPFYGCSVDFKSFFAPTLEWPILCYFKPDSVNHSAYLFEAEFNDESIRQGAIARFVIVDENYGKLEGIDLYCNGSKCINCVFSIPAKKHKVQINLRLDIPLEMGDRIIKGYIVADYSDIDEANGIELDNQFHSIGTFYASQHIHFSWGYWVVLILMVVLLGFIGKYVFDFIFFYLSWVIGMFTNPSIPVNKMSAKKKQDKKEKEKTADRELTAREAMQKLQVLYKSIITGQDNPDTRILGLPEPWRTIVLEYHCSGETKKPRLNRGIWSNPKDRNNSRWYPDENEMPKAEANDLNYNPRGLTLKKYMYEIGRKNYIIYKDGYPDFKPFADKTFNYDVGIKIETDRGQLHSHLKRYALPSILNIRIEDVQSYLNNKHLTIHENIDGSFSLIDLAIHSSIEHNGGVYMCNIISRGPQMPTVKNSEFIDSMTHPLTRWRRLLYFVHDCFTLYSKR